jgi:hypothetical protein
MILNTKIFNQVVETAKAKSTNNPTMLRAIDRAVNEINRGNGFDRPCHAHPKT